MNGGRQEKTLSQNGVSRNGSMTEAIKKEEEKEEEEEEEEEAFLSNFTVHLTKVIAVKTRGKFWFDSGVCNLMMFRFSLTFSSGPTILVRTNFKMR